MWNAKKTPNFLTSALKRIRIFLYILQEDFEIEEEIVAAPQKDLEVA